MEKRNMIIDGHIHYSLPVSAESIFKMLDYTKTDKGNIVVLFDKHRSTALPDALRAKYISNGRLYVYGALDLSAYYRHNENVGKVLAKHVDNLMKCGCDGIKMLEGKPTMRNKYPIPNFNSNSFEEYWEYMEKNSVPIVWHVNDPEEFWDINKVPSWALSSGWFYGKDSVNNIDQYNQINNVLERHPNLKIIFAHFYFLSAQLDVLSNLFDRYPNIGVDITPGIEMFQNFSKDVNKAKLFFEKYQDRIYYGTDIAATPEIEEMNSDFEVKDSMIRSSLCRDYLKNTEPMLMKGDKDSLLGKDDFTLLPLGLSKEIQTKILGKNFYKLNKGEPKKVNIQETLKEIERVREQITFLSTLPINNGKKPNYSIVNMVKDFFEKESM